MSLEISRDFVEGILNQSRLEYPDEACGVILGPIGLGSALRIKPMINAAHSPIFYEFGPMDLLALYREVDDRDEEHRHRAAHRRQAFHQGQRDRADADPLARGRCAE